MVNHSSVKYVTNLRDIDELQKEYKVRDKDTIEIEIPADITTREAVEKKYGADNTNYVKTRNVFKCKTDKEEWKKFEDKVWRILYKMGFSILNEGECKVAEDEHFNNSKQIDVFAKIENIVCIIECKDSSNSTKPVKEYLNEFAGIKSNCSAFIKKHFAGEKVYLRWIFATSFPNYEKGAEELAKQHGIWIINNWDYYEKLIEVLGDAARYQFLANLMNNREIPNLAPTVYALGGTMAHLPFYLFSITPDELMKLSFVPHSSAESGANIELYQRLVKPGRFNEIQSYIKNSATNVNGITVNGLFPTNIVVNFRTKKPILFEQIKCDKEPKPGLLHLPNTYGSAEIIDGQHRLFSYARLEQAKTETIPVIAFNNLSATQRADIFYNINGKQVTVSKNLINQILCIQDWKSNDEKDKFYALPLKIIMDLNEDSDSPFYRKIKMEGGNLKGTVSMTYAEVSDNFRKLQFFSKDKPKRKSNASPHYELLFYKTMEETLVQTKKLLNTYFTYFIEHSSKMKTDWDSGDKSYFDTNGVIVPLLRILKDILKYIFAQEDLKDRVNVPMNEYMGRLQEFQNIICNYFDNMSEEELSYFRLAPGGQGYSIRHDLLVEAINKEKNDFMKERVEELKKRREEAIAQPSEDILDYINKFENMMRFIFTRILMEHYGDTWFTIAVPENVSMESLRNNLRSSIQGFDNMLKGCYLVDLKTILYYGKNYDLLESFVDFEHNSSIKKSERANWIVEFSNYRNDLVHSKVKKGSDEYIKRVEFIKNKCDLLTPLFDEYIKKNNLDDKWIEFENLGSKS